MNGNELNVSAKGAVEVGTVGAGAVGAGAGAAAKSGTKAKPVPVGQSKKQPEKAKLLTKPTKPPISGEKTVTVQSGETTFSIATKYHISMEELLAANPGVDKDKIYENQKLNVPYRTDKAWNKYQKDIEAYENQQYLLSEQKLAAERKRNLNKKIDIANTLIQKAKELEHDKSYTFKVDKKTGDIIVTLKKDMELGDVRSDFRLPKGHLRSMNPEITKKYKPSTMFNLDEGIRVSDWDNADVKKGDSFKISPDVFKPSGGFWKDLFD